MAGVRESLAVFAAAMRRRPRRRPEARLPALTAPASAPALAASLRDEGFAAWFLESVHLDASAAVDVREARHVYERWCAAAGYPPIPRAQFEAFLAKSAALLGDCVAVDGEAIHGAAMIGGGHDDC